MKVLIVEDERELAQNMTAYLAGENYLCETASDFETARGKIESFEYDCILLDISLPDGNGLSLLEELKKDNKTDGVIIISAKNAIDDKIRGLNLGADDYLAKPFHLSELSARIAAVIRRRRFEGHTSLVLNEITVDLQAKNVSVHGKQVDLTRKEFDLLLYLASNKNRVVSKNAIAEHLDSEADSFENYDVIYAHIKNLKKKLPQAGATDYIKSIYGMGYKFEI